MGYSVIIPVYNCKKYLKDCVHSIRFAEIEEYEILLIDDGSTDGSGALCDELAACYPEVRVIHQENGGVSSARNRGIQEARGDKVLMIDADDSIDAPALGRILSDPRCDKVDLVIFGLTFDFYHHEKCYRRDPIFYEYDGIMSREQWGESFLSLYQQNSLGPVWNKVFKREILIQNGLELDQSMFLYEDYEFVLRYLQFCETIWNVPQAVYHYRQSEDEGNAGRRLARIACLSHFMAKIENAVDCLCDANTFVSADAAGQMLSRLFHVLAREKIAVSDLAQIRQICDDYARWYQTHELPKQDSKFHHRLIGRNALALKFEDRKTALRHWIAVRVKAFVRRTWE